MGHPELEYRSVDNKGQPLTTLTNGMPIWQVKKQCTVELGSKGAESEHRLWGQNGMLSGFGQVAESVSTSVKQDDSTCLSRLFAAKLLKVLL